MLKNKASPKSYVNLTQNDKNKTIILPLTLENCMFFLQCVGRM